MYGNKHWKIVFEAYLKPPKLRSKEPKYFYDALTEEQMLTGGHRNRQKYYQENRSKLRSIPARPGWDGGGGLLLSKTSFLSTVEVKQASESQTRQWKMHNLEPFNWPDPQNV